MTVVNSKSISGINSITTGSGSDNLLTIHSSDSNNTERLRIDSTGTTRITTGIVTTFTATSSAKVGSGVTLSPDGDVFATGVCTATSFVGDGSGLTGAGPTLTNGADNRVITASGANAIQGESTLTYNGSGTLEISDNGSSYTLTGAGVCKHEIGASASDNDLVIQNNKTAVNAASNIIFKGSGSGGESVKERLRIDSNGNARLGPGGNNTNSTNYTTLTISNTAGGVVEFLDSGNNNIAGDIIGAEGSGMYISSKQDTPIIFRTGASNSEKVRIDVGGNMNVTGIVTATAFVPTSQGALSHRNIIVNGAMTISQRGTSAATSGYQTVDRFQFGGAWPGSAITQSQADVGYNSAPYDKGFRKSYKLTNSNQGSTSSSSHIEITYSFEGQEIANSGWDYVSSSKKITLSFWIKSSVAQTFYGYFRTFPGVDMKYSFPIVCSTTDWEFKTVSVVGESNFAENIQNSFPNTTSRAMVLRIVPYYGTTYTSSSAVNNAWQNYSDSTVTPDYATSWFLTNGATFEMTGMQLEVGPVATPFEHRSHGEELRRCQRYFQKDISTRASWNSGNVAGRQFPVRFITEMRDTPTISFSNFQGAGSLSASAASRQGYNAYMSGSERFYEWRHTATAEI